MGEAVRRHLLIEGRVQGVFFRDSTRRVAWAAGVSGWVANRLDGSVEAVLEGDREAVERVAAWCSRGPSGACVERVRVVAGEPVEGLEGFHIR